MADIKWLFFLIRHKSSFINIFNYKTLRMGLIREPKGVDLIVGPSVLTDKDRKEISAVITAYKKTGKLPVKAKGVTKAIRGKRKAIS